MGHIRLVGIFFLAGIVSLTSLGPLVATAGADPIADKKAQAKAIQDQVDANSRQISALGEQYNGSQLALERAEEAIAAAQAQIAATKHEVARIKGLVAERAAAVYRRALAGESLRDFDFSDALAMLKRRTYAESQARRDDQLLDRLAEARAQLARERTEAERARADADAQRQQINQAKGDLETATAQQQEILKKVQGELAQLVEQERKRREAEALRAAQARFAAQSANHGNPEDFPNLPPPGPAAAAAIEFARAQLGKPYLYAAAGPNSYDCSGLTMAAYRAAGISLPHYSGAQYQMLPHVRLDAMLPGDLVFWGSGGSRHVAMYVGAARIIEAGGSGHDVHVGPIWGSPVGAARPA
jgi:cell wall-associated NlpC family hydrolase